jgi:hypothetical protein
MEVRGVSNHQKPALEQVARPAVGAMLAIAAALVEHLERLSARYLSQMERSLKTRRDRLDPVAYPVGATDLYTLDFNMSPARSAILERDLEEARRRDRPPSGSAPS